MAPTAVVAFNCSHRKWGDKSEGHHGIHCNGPSQQNTLSSDVISDLFIALQLFVHCTCALFHTVDCTSHMCIAVIANGGDKSEGHHGIHCNGPSQQNTLSSDVISHLFIALQLFVHCTTAFVAPLPCWWHAGMSSISEAVLSLTWRSGRPWSGHPGAKRKRH